MSRTELTRDVLFGRRALILGGAKLSLISAVLGRLYFLQVVEGDRYKTLADENRINIRLLPPPRGKIFDRFGVPLAINRQNYRLIIISEQTDNVEATLKALDAAVVITDAEVERVRREVGRKRGFVPITVRENLSWEDVARIEVNAPDLPGVAIEVGQSRHYPHHLATAHFLGYVAPVSDRDLEGEQGRDPVLELPGFRVGRTGLERQYDLAMRGRAGDRQVEVNALGREVRELERRDGKPGAALTTTIDVGLQNFTAQRVAAESAGVVVMDVHNGDVLTMVSVPEFDPNLFNEGLSDKDWRALSSNPKSPLTNKAVAGQFAPGSTFKMVVALAALEAGIISPDDQVFCPGSFKFGNARFHCWKRGGHGRMVMHEAVKQSCDVYFYEIGRRVGIERIAAMARKLGLGETLDVDLPGERPGLVPDKAWKEAALGEPWVGGETLVAAIGQGYMLTTPLQLAVMTARLVNGGYAVTPRLVRAVGDQVVQAQPDVPPIDISQRSMDMVRAAMDDVVNHQRGTAYRARIEEPQYRMGGKTGTAQVRRISKAERATRVLKNEERPWKDRDHALFVGYAPLHAPRYTVAVVIEHGGSGSKAAAPVARDVLAEAQRRNAAGAPALQIAAASPADAGDGPEQP
ncbi:MAG: penicillin-binding protein 2 [Alphaproteobacteria bacterium]|nr:penicillin-binding protein 2 [Alphaproteobacteria bacterium]